MEALLQAILAELKRWTQGPFARLSPSDEIVSPNSGPRVVVLGSGNEVIGHVVIDSIGGGTIALDAPTLAALETINVGNFPGSQTLVFKQLNAVDITTITSIWTPAAGKKFRLMGGAISIDTPVSVLFEDDAPGSFVYQTPFLQGNVPFTFPPFTGGRLSGAADRALKATAAGLITGTIFGTEE